MSLFVRVVTHYGSNESNDSFGFFCAGGMTKLYAYRCVLHHANPLLQHLPLGTLEVHSFS